MAVGFEGTFADAWERVADAIPDAPAQVHGDRRFTWREFDARADGVAQALVDAGLRRDDKVAQYLYNCPEYLESVFAASKAAMVAVNTNYRYGPEEIVYLWNDADVRAVVFHGGFADVIERLRPGVPDVKAWLWVDDGSGGCPAWAVPYEDAARSAPGRVTGARSRDDLYLLYTGGTTGMPKGVMWRQEDLLNYATSRTDEPPPFPPPAPGPVGCPACPLMHGTGSFVSFIVLQGGGCVVTLPGRRYDPVELLDAIDRERVSVLAIVGDAFAKPWLQAMDAEPDRWDISSLAVVISSGVMWSEPVKRGLLEHHPAMVLTDAFSSSEALRMGQSISTGDSVTTTARFELGEHARLVDAEGRDVPAGEPGLLAVKGFTPQGYYKDPEKSARTFRQIDGERWAIPGDWAVLEPDGTLRVLGRGSGCINTGGEKVWPEEVEEALKTHAAVRDAAVIGLADERFGESVNALVELQPEAAASERTLVEHVRSMLAHYKAPRRVLFVDSVRRAPNGKLDYRRLRDQAEAMLSEGAER